MKNTVEKLTTEVKPKIKIKGSPLIKGDNKEQQKKKVIKEIAKKAPKEKTIIEKVKEAEKKKLVVVMYKRTAFIFNWIFIRRKIIGFKNFITFHKEGNDTIKFKGKIKPSLWGRYSNWWNNHFNGGKKNGR